MSVRRDVIDSVFRQKAARWGIETLHRWFNDWEKERTRKRPSGEPQHPLTRFIGHSWWKGNQLPSSLNWDRDLLTLGEFLCIVIKTAYSHGNQNKENGGFLLWILESIVEAAQSWTIASGSGGFNEALSLAKWLEDSLPRSAIQSEYHQKIRNGLLVAFSQCQPDLTRPRTLHAYTECLAKLNGMYDLVQELGLRNPMIERLIEIASVLKNALLRLQKENKNKYLNQKEMDLYKLCQSWLGELGAGRHDLFPEEILRRYRNQSVSREEAEISTLEPRITKKSIKEELAKVAA